MPRVWWSDASPAGNAKTRRGRFAVWMRGLWDGSSRSTMSSISAGQPLPLPPCRTSSVSCCSTNTGACGPTPRSTATPPSTSGWIPFSAAASSLSAILAPTESWPHGSSQVRRALTSAPCGQIPWSVTGGAGLRLTTTSGSITCSVIATTPIPSCARYGTAFRRSAQTGRTRSQGPGCTRSWPPCNLRWTGLYPCSSSPTGSTPTPPNLAASSITWTSGHRRLLLPLTLRTYPVLVIVGPLGIPDHSTDRTVVAPRSSAPR